MIRIIKGGETATIKEDLTVISANQDLKADIQEEIESVLYNNDTALPALLLVYENLTSSAKYEKIEINQELFESLKGNNLGVDVIF